MRQSTYADACFEPYRKPRRRERFLTEMDRVGPWIELLQPIAEPHLNYAAALPLTLR